MTNDNNKLESLAETNAYETAHDVIVGLQYLSLLAKASDVPAFSAILDKAIKNSLDAAKSAYGKAGRKFLAELANDLRDNEQFIDAVSGIKDPQERRRLLRLVQSAAKK